MLFFGPAAVARKAAMAGRLRWSTRVGHKYRRFTSRHGRCERGSGKSAGQPFCDAAHKGTEFASKQFIAEKTGTAYLCGCKRRDNAPFCDDSHKTQQP